MKFCNLIMLTMASNSLLADISPSQAAKAVEAGTLFNHGANSNISPEDQLRYIQKLTATGDQANLKQARTMLLDLANKGNRSAQFFLSDFYENGHGGTVDKAQSLSWLNKAASGGCPDALFSLALKYESGIDVPKNEKTAFTLYRISANMNHPHSQNNLANCYEKGKGVAMDLKLALDWYKKAARNGVAEAFFSIGIINLKNEKNDTMPSVAVSAAYFKVSSKLGLPIGEVYFRKVSPRVNIDLIDRCEEVIAHEYGVTDRLKNPQIYLKSYIDMLFQNEFESMRSQSPVTVEDRLKVMKLTEAKAQVDAAKPADSKPPAAN